MLGQSVKIERKLRANSPTGDRLKEAGNINNSLMTLRRCIDGLRKNQRGGANEQIPYRSSKITHLFRNFFEVLGGVKLVICINPCASEFDENLNVLQFAEAAQSIQCKREIKTEMELDPEEILAKSEEAALERERKNRRRTILQPWTVREDRLDHGGVLPCLELFDVDDADMLSSLIDSMKTRIDRRDTADEESTRLGHTFRKKLTHYERQNVDALGKLRMIEPQIAKNEIELEKLQREVKKVEKKNRALMETQRVYEIDRKELKQEVHQKSNLLKQTDAQKRKIELDSKRKIEDHQRKVKLETERRLQETQNRANRDVQEKDEKLSKLRNILDRTGTPIVRGRRPIVTPTSSARAKLNMDESAFSEKPIKPPKPDKSKYDMRQRSISESKIKQEFNEESTPIKSKVNNSTSNLENRDPSGHDSRVRPNYFGSMESIVNPRSLTRKNISSSSLKSKRGRSQSDLRFNPRNETTEMMQKRRSSSADGRKWLAHTPNETVHTNTVLQNSIMLTPEHLRMSSSLIRKFKAKLALIKPAISANKRVHIPSVTDLKRTDDYLLTHQEQGDQNQLKTTLVKGEIFDTRTGGVQVKFTGKERLTTIGLDDNRRGTKRLSDESDRGSIASESSAHTDIATRCGRAVVHERGSDTAHVTQVNNLKRIRESQTSIRIVDNSMTPYMNESYESNYI